MLLRGMVILCLGCFLSACSLESQILKVQPELNFTQLNGVLVPVELVVKDNRENKSVLGYRNAKDEGEIKLKPALEAAIGKAMLAALSGQGIKTKKGPQPFTVVELSVDKLSYKTPDESWVSHIKMQAEITLTVSRGATSFKKRFLGNRNQDVATAPSQIFNEKYMNGLLSEIINKAMNDQEVVNFLK